MVANTKGFLSSIMSMLAFNSMVERLEIGYVYNKVKLFYVLAG